jgi:hypothetical protein
MAGGKCAPEGKSKPFHKCTALIQRVQIFGDDCINSKFDSGRN